MSTNRTESPLLRLTLGEFLAEAKHFRLGVLPTEQPHPGTTGLASQTVQDPPGAIARLKAVDLAAFEKLLSRAGEFDSLRAAIQATFADGGRVFLCGCGATGRLVLNLEYLWRKKTRGTGLEDRVFSFMAGGDVALVRSIEGFEDHPEFGARQLEDAGFRSGDLLISVTEGGETPFVIGATERAVSLAGRAPWFIFCNPVEALSGIERSRRVIENDAIRSIALPIGPMSLSGSTRLQACSVMMLGIGLALLEPDGDERIRERMERFVRGFESLDLGFTAETAMLESRAYAAEEDVIYRADEYAITILTDTTERAPTFNTLPFENRDESGSRRSPCYLVVNGARSAPDAWRRMLGRNPRPIEWPETRRLTGSKRLVGFDFSENAVRRRNEPGSCHWFRIESAGASESHPLVRFDALEVPLAVPGSSALEHHLVMKLILNIHSLLLMGRLGRFESNVMTWVRPTNRKLVDRTIRYAQAILAEKLGAPPEYEKVAEACFQAMDSARADESVVLRIVDIVLDP